jgi:Domain of unknown function (DUF4180)
MSEQVYELAGFRVLECAGEGPALKTERDAVDLIGAMASTKADWALIPGSRLDAEFFSLRTRIAGAFLQKFVTYGKRVAILGTIPKEFEDSRALRDFVKECNRGQQIWFVDNRDELRKRLGKERPEER